MKNCYNIILYEACRQTDDQDQRERAYTDLFRYLYRAAYNRQPELAEEVAQHALQLVFAKIDKCRSPVTFLAFAQGLVWQAFQEIRRVANREVPLEAIGESGIEDALAIDTPLLRQERLQLLVDTIRDLPDNQQKTIFWKFFEGLSDEYIGERLGIKPGHVRVLRHRGLERLRNDQRLRDMHFE